jgi:glycosyltransferase involved in cell wall biosynthesis
MKIGVDEDLVSIITCVYNGQRFLEEALSSALCQSYENVEVIVVNDCSTDQSEDVIHGFSGDHRIRETRRT